MRFSVITPSLNQSDYLKRCIASVADQRLEVQHIVQDAGSTDGTLDWLTTDPRVELHSERDDGMYDAINRGFKRATGDLLAWLNCDEQYLPGTLSLVSDFFQRHPAVDMVFGDAVMVNEACRYVCHRKVERPRLYHSWTCHLSTLSCGMFFRNRVLADGNGLLDTSYRCGGDGEWMVRLLRNGLRTRALRQFTSAFTLDPHRLSRSASALAEWKRLRDTAPAWARLLSPVWVTQHRLRRFLNGSYRQPPFTFSIYTPDNPDHRVEQRVDNPTFRLPAP